MSANIEDNRLVYTPREVAELLGMSGNGVYNAIAAGELPGVKIGKKVVVPKAMLHALLSSTNSAE